MPGINNQFPSRGSQVPLKNLLRNIADSAAAANAMSIDGKLCGDVSSTGMLLSTQYGVEVQCFEVRSEWKQESAWATGTSYAVGDIVYLNGRVFVCLSSHTSGTFYDVGAVQGDLTATPAKWQNIEGPTLGLNWIAKARAVSGRRKDSDTYLKALDNTSDNGPDDSYIWVIDGPPEGSQTSTIPSFAINQWVWCVWNYTMGAWLVLTGGGGSGITPADNGVTALACALTSAGYIAPETWTLNIPATCYAIRGVSDYAVVGDTYSISGVTYTVISTYPNVFDQTTGFYLIGASDPPGSGTLTLVTGTGPASISYTSLVVKTSTFNGEYTVYSDETYSRSQNSWYNDLNYRAWTYRLPTPLSYGGKDFYYLVLNVGYQQNYSWNYETATQIETDKTNFFFEVLLSTYKGDKTSDNPIDWVDGPTFHFTQNDYESGEIYHAWNYTALFNPLRCTDIPHQAVEEDANSYTHPYQQGVDDPISPVILYGHMVVGAGGTDTSNLVPYVNATRDVDLGNHNLGAVRLTCDELELRDQTT